MWVHFILPFSNAYIYLNLRVERKQMITYRGFILIVDNIVRAGSLGATGSVGVTAGAGL